MSENTEQPQNIVVNVNNDIIAEKLDNISNKINEIDITNLTAAIKSLKQEQEVINDEYCY